MDFGSVCTKDAPVSLEDSTNSSLIIKSTSYIMVVLHKIMLDFSSFLFLSFNQTIYL